MKERRPRAIVPNALAGNMNMVQLKCTAWFSAVARLLAKNAHKGGTEMEFIEKGKALEQVAQGESSREVGDCSRFAQGRFLDELPGAAFVAITLVWIISSFAHLVW
jgi:hypothetical protein